MATFFLSHDLLASWTLWSVLIVIYLLPGLIAYARSRHNNIGFVIGFVITNILFGWTVIAWMVMLVQAFRNPSPAPQEKDKEEDIPDHKDSSLATTIPDDKDSSLATTLYYNPWTQTWR
jgi:hypothetical protein